MVKKILMTIVILISMLLLVEIAARVKLSLQTNNYRYLIYYAGMVKTQPVNDIKHWLQPIRFKKGDNKNRKVIMIGTSVIARISDDLKALLIKDGWHEFNSIGAKQQSIEVEYGDNSVIIMETMILPAIYNDFFGIRNGIKKFLGTPLYTNLYQNSVFFLILSEKMTGAVSFSAKSKQEFIEESLPVYEETFKNIQKSDAKILLVNFPNRFLENGQKAFGVHCGEVADMATTALRTLVDKYSIPYLDIYTLYNKNFGREDYEDDFHLNKNGAKKAAIYIREALKAITKN